MKTKTLLVLSVVCMIASVMPLTTEAKGIFGDIIKIPKVKVEDIIRSTSTKHYNISLDGTYYGVSASKSAGYKNKDIIMQGNFSIDRPTFIQFHGINNGYQSAAIYRIYDQDGYQVCGRIDISSNNTQDQNLFLKPGRYKITVEFFSANTQGNVETRFKMQGEGLNITASNNTSIFSAQPLSIGVSASNYFRSIRDWGNDTTQHYYSIDVAYTYNLHIYTKKMQEGNMSIVLLDEDERQIGNSMYCYDNIIDKNVTLNPGRYYLRVKREQCTGAYYKVRVD
ncbi:hypothetical protein [uncultured Phascolarctobacterium sp.]|uniref:hypothetical protein n=1 Tax=uncultured Phascolarctobacterium sp. TaxID=512296 RepID=UPI0025F198D6|nr:hypothetical protein [uncultured Phascolarctobacterium sp.]